MAFELSFFIQEEISVFRRIIYSVNVNLNELFLTLSQIFYNFHFISLTSSIDEKNNLTIFPMNALNNIGYCFLLPQAAIFMRMHKNQKQITK